jgi:hypothetical protein
MPVKRRAKSTILARKGRGKSDSKALSDAVIQPAPKAELKRRRARGSVRERILTLLQKGPANRSELLKNGGFSQASLFLVLKALRNEHLIVEDKATRQLRLVSKAAHAESMATTVVHVPRIAKVKSAEPAALAVVPQDLHIALEAVMVRLAPIDLAAEKLHVLEQLTQITPDPVAEVLRLLAGDVLRFSERRGVI